MTRGSVLKYRHITEIDPVSIEQSEKILKFSKMKKVGTDIGRKKSFLSLYLTPHRSVSPTICSHLKSLNSLYTNL